MIISPDRDDFSTILNTLGKLTLGLAGFISLPLIVALIHREFSPLCDFFLTLLIATSLGLFLLTFFPLKKEITWVHAFFSVSFGWMIFSLLGAIPLYLSGHFISFVDAWFESTSGFATTGLILI
ncbi:MAG: hypothetical protein PHV17_05965, partial [Candidatus Omnitrophica bacterium]|nr:hypothetical protein [Candidatus Omnitrophota bacterium]